MYRMFVTNICTLNVITGVQICCYGLKTRFSHYSFQIFMNYSGIVRQNQCLGVVPEAELLVGAVAPFVFIINPVVSLLTYYTNTYIYYIFIHTYKRTNKQIYMHACIHTYIHT